MSAVDYPYLMQILSCPRPSGSAANRETLRALQAWLEQRGLPCCLQAFTLYPYFFICIGLWTVSAHTLLAIAIWLRWGWVASLIAVLGILGGLLDAALDIPLVTWPGRTLGQNLLMEFGCAKSKRELVISAHYDSKTELFDHHTRTFFVRNLRFGITLAVLLGILAPLERLLVVAWAQPVHTLGVLLTLPLLFLAWGLGSNLSMGKLRHEPSQGAVDNGAACAILLGLAQHIADGGVKLKNTNLTLAVFDGDEVNMQGSRAYVRSRDWPFPAAALNLEIMAQDGAYVFWEQDGFSLKLFPTDQALNQAVAQAVATVTSSPAIPAGPINSDGYSFIRIGIPTTTLGTYDKRLESRGFHLPSDNLSRVRMARLGEAVEILSCFIEAFDERNAGLIQ